MEVNKISNFLGTTSDKFQNETFSVSIVKYAQPVSEEWHYHENAHLSTILVGGNLESRKKEELIVEPGKIMTYREGEIHRNRHTMFPSKNLNIELSHAFFNDEIKFSHLQLDKHAYLSMIRLYYELSINDVYSQQSIKQILNAFFYQEETSRKQDWMYTLLSLLNDRWQEFISLEEISKELRLHPVTISKYFTRHLKCTLADYMRKIKVKHAIHLIFNSNKSLTEIAYVCGFSDQSHMNRLFKHYIGFSPKMLRKI